MNRGLGQELGPNYSTARREQGAGSRERNTPPALSFYWKKKLLAGVSH